jgi:hypothetical protein
MNKKDIHVRQMYMSFLLKYIVTKLHVCNTVILSWFSNIPNSFPNISARTFDILHYRG